jgi:hypothetical protein
LTLLPAMHHFETLAGVVSGGGVVASGAVFSGK